MCEERYIIGIDPGLASLGWGVIRLRDTEKNTRPNGKMTADHLAHGLITTNAKDNLAHRLLQIEQSIESVFLRYPISVLVYEQQFFVKNVTSGLQVAHALGVILLYAAKQGLIVESYTPREIKLQITGSASAKKETVQNFIALQLGLDEVKIHHSADALGAALCYSYKKTSV